jgi:plastocyanin
VALVLAACGSSSSSTTSTTSTTSSSNGSGGASAVPPSTKAQSTEHLALAANPQGELKYDKTTLTAKAGVASLTFANSSQVPHNVTIENSAGTTVGGTTTFAGGSHTIRISLKAGTYKFFCSVPGHREAGMEGTLTVQ